MINTKRSPVDENRIEQSTLKEKDKNFKDLFTKRSEDKVKTNNSDEEVDYRIYGYLWENYIKTDVKAKEALASYYQVSIDDLVFAQKKEKPENYKNIFVNTKNI